MKVIETDIKNLSIIKLDLIVDDRGSFSEIYREMEIENTFGGIRFVQHNQSTSKYGVLRGLHFQSEPYAQSKLVRASFGSIQDVVVDLRKGSDTFGEHRSFCLSDKSGDMLFIPKGFAHGFLVLSEFAVVDYSVDSYYRSDQENGIRFDDKSLNIEWKVDVKDLIISQKDSALPLLTHIF